MFDAAFPKVFAGLAGRRLKPVRVLVVVLVAHSQHEVFPFEVDLRDPRPEVVANLINGNFEGEAINHSAHVCKPSSYFQER